MTDGPLNVPPIDRLTQERLREVLAYDPETGVFTWINPRDRRRLGMIAGTLDADGYRDIAVDGRRYEASHLAWLYVHGRFPASQIDHRNRCRDDNRFDNLREATRSQNKANSARYTNNTSGFKGVRRKRDRWEARIRKDGKLIHIGSYATPEEAHSAYVAEAKALFGEFARAS